MSREYTLSITLNVPKYWNNSQLEKYLKNQLKITEIKHMMIETIKEDGKTIDWNQWNNE